MEETKITYMSILEILNKHRIGWQSLLYGRTPEAADGNRVLFVMSYGVDKDRLDALRKQFMDEYTISVEVVIPENSSYVDRSYAWL